MISHNDIPNNIRTPMVAIEFDNSGAVTGTPSPLHKTLMFAYGAKKGTPEAGTAPFNKITRVQDYARAKEAFGIGSMGAAMAKAYFLNNEQGNLYILPLAPDLLVGFEYVLRLQNDLQYYGFDRTLHLYIAGVHVPIILRAYNSLIADIEAIEAAINLNTDLPVNAYRNGDDSVKIESKFTGDVANDIRLVFNYNGELFPPNTSAELNLVMQSASGTPNLNMALAALGDDWYQHIIMPFTDDDTLRTLRDELMRRWGPMSQIDGVAYMAKAGYFGEMSDFGINKGKNAHVFCTLGIGQSGTPAYIAAAAVGGLASKYLAIDPARPLQTLVLKGVLAPKRRLDQNERNLLLYDGISTHVVNDAGDMAIERLITMYRSNASGMPDPSYLDVMTPATLSYIRYATRVRITQKFPRHKLCDDDTKINPGQAVVKPKIIKAELIALYKEHEYNGLVENTKKFIETLVVERDTNDRNRVRVLAHPDLINQFMVYSETCRFVL